MRIIAEIFATKRVHRAMAALDEVARQSQHSQDPGCLRSDALQAVKQLHGAGAPFLHAQALEAVELIGTPQMPSVPDLVERALVNLTEHGASHPTEMGWKELKMVLNANRKLLPEALADGQAFRSWDRRAVSRMATHEYVHNTAAWQVAGNIRAKLGTIPENAQEWQSRFRALMDIDQSAFTRNDWLEYSLLTRAPGNLMPEAIREVMQKIRTDAVDRMAGGDYTNFPYVYEDLGSMRIAARPKVASSQEWLDRLGRLGTMEKASSGYWAELARLATAETRFIPGEVQPVIPSYSGQFGYSLRNAAGEGRSARYTGAEVKQGTTTLADVMDGAIITHRTPAVTEVETAKQAVMQFKDMSAYAMTQDDWARFFRTVEYAQTPESQLQLTQPLEALEEWQESIYRAVAGGKPDRYLRMRFEQFKAASVPGIQSHDEWMNTLAKLARIPDDSFGPDEWRIAHRLMAAAEDVVDPEYRPYLRLFDDGMRDAALINAGKKDNQQLHAGIRGILDVTAFHGQPLHQAALMMEGFAGLEAGMVHNFSRQVNIADHVLGVLNQQQLDDGFQRELRDSITARLQSVKASISGERSTGYKRYPDFAEIGEAAADMKLLAALKD